MSDSENVAQMKSSVHTSGQDEPQADGRHGRAAGSYQAPALRVLGSVAEVTQGNFGVNTDGLTQGS